MRAEIADNYFQDRRPKILVFPTNAVCTSFYRELRNPHFPNRCMPATRSHPPTA